MCLGRSWTIPPAYEERDCLHTDWVGSSRCDDLRRVQWRNDFVADVNPL